ETDCCVNGGYLSRTTRKIEWVSDRHNARKRSGGKCWSRRRQITELHDIRQISRMLDLPVPTWVFGHPVRVSSVPDEVHWKICTSHSSRSIETTRLGNLNCYDCKADNTEDNQTTNSGYFWSSVLHWVLLKLRQAYDVMYD